MSLEKPEVKKWSRQQNERFEPELIEVPEAVGNVAGVNGVVDNYYFTERGTQHFWSINLSNQPGQKKRLLNVLQAKTFLLNYATNSYPSRINILVNQVTPTKDKTGNLSHVIGVLVPDGAPTVVVNPGNVIGYNISYSLINATPAIDITGIPLLTFDITIDDQVEPVAYPLAQGITANMQITRVIF